MRLQLEKSIEGELKHFGKFQHQLSVESTMLENNILKPSFEFNGSVTSGYLKYMNFIPEGTKVTITLEWETE